LIDARRPRRDHIERLRPWAIRRPAIRLAFLDRKSGLGPRHMDSMSAQERQPPFPTPSESAQRSTRQAHQRCRAPEGGSVGAFTCPYRGAGAQLVTTLPAQLKRCRPPVMRCPATQRPAEPAPRPPSPHCVRCRPARAPRPGRAASTGSRS
jgi:hypothetical protein